MLLEIIDLFYIHRLDRKLESRPSSLCQASFHSNCLTERSPATATKVLLAVVRIAKAARPTDSTAIAYFIRLNLISLQNFNCCSWLEIGFQC